MPRSTQGKPDYSRAGHRRQLVVRDRFARMRIIELFGLTDALDVALTDLDTTVDGKLGDAPSDGTIYGRQNGAWVAVP